MFKQISEAYRILSNEEKRKKYDKYGTTDDEEIDFNAFTDVFGDFFQDDGLFDDDNFDEFLGFLSDDVFNDNIMKDFKKMMRGPGKAGRKAGGRKFDPMKDIMKMMRQENDMFKEKKPKKKQSDSDGWETVSEDEVVEDDDDDVDGDK